MSLPPAPPVQLDRSRLPAGAAAIGVAMLSAVIALSATYSRKEGPLDASNFAMGVLAAVGLLAVAALASVMVQDADARAGLVSWPGAAGSVGLGLMVGVLITNDDASVYAGAAVVVVLAAAGYVLTKAPAFVLAAMSGLAVGYAQLFSDVFDGAGDGDNSFMIYGAGALVLVVALTALGWLLPTRSLTGVVVGAGGVVAIGAVFQILSIARTFAAFSGTSSSFDLTVPSEPKFSLEQVNHNPYENDVYAILGYCAVLVVLWLACYAATGNPGFKVLTIVLTVFSIPSATMALVTRHPTWWEVGAAAIGGAVLLAVAFGALTRPAAATADPPLTA